jgi:hypothetical protein
LPRQASEEPREPPKTIAASLRFHFHEIGNLPDGKRVQVSTPFRNPQHDLHWMFPGKQGDPVFNVDIAVNAEPGFSLTEWEIRYVESDGEVSDLFILRAVRRRWRYRSLVRAFRLPTLIHGMAASRRAA